MTTTVATTVTTTWNAAQSTRWNGDEGRTWADERDRFDRMARPLGAALAAAARIRHGEAVLDVGCGAGATTLAATRAARGGRVVGIDISRPLLDVARARVPGAHFVVGDAQTYRFEPGAFDVAISRNGLMLFDDPAIAFGNLASALRPGGRLAFVTWADAAANGWFAIPAAAVAAQTAVSGAAPPPPSPTSPPGACAFSLADPAVTTALLHRAGFSDVRAERRDTRLWIATDVEDAVELFERSAADVVATAPARVVDHIVATLRVMLVPWSRPDGVWLPSAWWIVTARRP
jgi:SAM-dependent methyltransferase